MLSVPVTFNGSDLIWSSYDIVRHLQSDNFRKIVFLAVRCLSRLSRFSHFVPECTLAFAQCTRKSQNNNFNDVGKIDIDFVLARRQYMKSL